MSVSVSCVCHAVSVRLNSDGWCVWTDGPTAGPHTAPPRRDPGRARHVYGIYIYNIRGAEVVVELYK